MSLALCVYNCIASNVKTRNHCKLTRLHNNDIVLWNRIGFYFLTLDIFKRCTAYWYYCNKSTYWLNARTENVCLKTAYMGSFKRYIYWNYMYKKPLRHHAKLPLLNSCRASRITCMQIDQLFDGRFYCVLYYYTSILPVISTDMFNRIVLNTFNVLTSTLILLCFDKTVSCI